jgi:nitrate/nitrite transport system permease protein
MNNSLIKFLTLTGLTWFVPLVRIAAGDNPTQQLRQLWLIMGVPIVAFMLFLGLWGATASKVNTSLGTIPGPSAVWIEIEGLISEHHSEQLKKTEFYQRQKARNQEKLAEDPILVNPHIWIKFSPVCIRYLLDSLSPH